jgi:fatty-acyl-CoA synthase
VIDTILSSLILQLRDRPSRTGIFLDEDDREPSFLSYPGIYQRVQAAARAFRCAGIAKGTRVILPFATTFDCIVAFLALAGVGAIPLSVKTPASGGNPREYAEYLRLLVSRFGASFILDVPGLVPDLLPIPRIQVPGESGGDFADWAASAGDDIAFIQFSSGTTSEPKGVVIRHRQLMRQLDMIVFHDGRTIKDVGASWLPLYHDMGLIGTLLTPIYAGHDLHLCSPARFLMNPMDWLHALSAHGVSLTAIPNFGLAYLLKRIREACADDLQGLRLDQLRRIYIGSDTIDPAVVNQLADELAPYGLRRKAFSPCYGMAEAVLMVSCKSQDDVMRVTNRMGADVVSVGPLLTGFELKLTRPEGAVAAPGETGEILLRGGSIGDGYFESDRPMLDAEGFYHTGDMGFVEDGELYITGRIGDRVKINGQNYYLPHFENVLQGHPELRPGGVAIIQAGGDLIVLAEPGNYRSSERLAGLRAELSDVLLLNTGVKVSAERVFFVRRGQIKRTSSGKLQRNLVTKAFIDRELKIFELTQTA